VVEGELPGAVLLASGAVALAALIALWAALSRKGRKEDEALAYLKGVTYVLSGDPDSAIAELSRAAQLNTQTVETYFALGALFRRKGDWDRAVRLHRNMLLRPGLPVEVKRRAELELALDLRHAGLKDQAAEVLERLIGIEPRHRAALLQLRQLLEDAGRWARAIEVQAELCRLDGGEGGDVLAHLLASAARSRLQEAPAEALALAERAVQLVPESADAQLSFGEALVAAGRAQEAADPLRRALRLEPELATRCLTLLGKALGDPAAVERVLLEHAREAGGERGVPCQLALCVLQRERGDSDAALARLRALLEAHPHLWEARKELGVLLLSRDRSEELRAEYAQVLGTLGQPALAFACDECRQRLPELTFRCPSCGAWDRVRRETVAPAAARI
jgi:lipopolysaccharide biosynthesis regulator YciM